MQTNSWEKVKKLLDEVLELETSQRQIFLANCGESDEIRTEVESLLAFEDKSENLMNLSAIEFSKDFFAEDEPVNQLIGQNIGIYQIVEEIGFGGMGAVYLAERKDKKFEQKVAIKMLKREFNSRKIRRRFEIEKEIQAKLHHPNIATLLDSGTTADGIPYLVMEYIEGLPIDKFCHEKSLDLKARLKLFNKVCESVGYAHQNLIIHRDLKPSNIIVTANGEPKLLDFGISKLLDAENVEDKNTVTILGAMTPEYASPEQIKGETVTTATDIYSLGVVLFNLLTGTHPFETDTKAIHDSLRTTDRMTPRIPSNAAFFREKEIKNISSELTSQTLLPFSAARLKGDLDNIILKSLRTEPERRYKTVEQFSADIWRFIDGIPILARPATVSYRASKFYQRNKVSVFAGVLIFVSLIAGIVLTMRQTHIAREQARVAAESQNFALAEAEKAKAEQVKAEKINRFMSKIIDYANPLWYAEGAKFGKEARVIDAILDLSEKIDVEFADEPDVAAELHHRFTFVIGPNAGSLKPEEQKARVLFHARRALELRKQFYGERHELVAKDMVYLYWANGVEETERAKYLMTAINMMRETNPNNLNLPYMLGDYVNRLIMPGTAELHEQYRNAVFPTTTENKYQISERYLREMLPIFRLHYKEDNYAIFSAECSLAYTLAMQEKWTDFDEHFNICKQGQEKVKDADWIKGFKTVVELIEKTLAEKQK